MYFEEIGLRIREARKAKGITQVALAQTTGLSRTTVNQLEAGAFPDLGVRKLLAILDALGLAMNIKPCTPDEKQDFLELACISANVSYRDSLAKEELAHVLATGKVPPEKRPHLRVVFDELPPAIFDGLIRQVSAWCPEERLSRNLASIAQQIQSTKRPTAQ